MTLESYFAGERSAGLLVAAIGAAAFAFSAWLWMSRHAFQSMVYPMVLVALIQVGVGVGLFVKTPGQAEATSRSVAAGQEGRSAEIARMERVNRSFQWIEWTELFLLAVGVLLVFTQSKPALVGVGMGLVVQSALMLAFDVFAQHRAQAYLDWLRR